MRLLPKGYDWTVYAWLVYFAFPLVLPFLFPAAPWERAVAVAATALSIPVYFAGYWLRGRRVLWAIAWCILLGSLLGKTTPGASVYFVYGASFLGKTFEQRTAFEWLGGLLALMGLEAWLWRWSPDMWISAWCSRRSSARW